MTDEYPGVSRLIVEWTDPDEIAFNWPFNANGREVKSVAVDGVEYVDAEKLKATNGELCAQVNELEAENKSLRHEREFAKKLDKEAVYFLRGKIEKLRAENGELQARIAELEAGRTCKITEYDEAPYPVCSECGAIQPDDFTVHYCWCCGAKVVDA